VTRPLSADFRERLVAWVLAGESCRSVAVRFGVAVSSVVQWPQRQRTTGSVVPGKMGGHRKPVLDPHRAFIVERITQTPRLTLHGLKAELAAHGVKVSQNAVWLFLRREGLKKILFALDQARADVSRRRLRWRSWQARLDPGRLVFIDETWIKTNMALCGGWGPEGARLPGLRPPRSLIPSHSSAHCAMTSSRHPASSTARSTANASCRHTRPPQPDRAGFLQNTGCSRLRSALSRTLWRQIGHLVQDIQPRECANYFANAGYASVKL
jgi:transposase